MREIYKILENVFCTHEFMHVLVAPLEHVQCESSPQGIGELWRRQTVSKSLCLCNGVLLSQEPSRYP